MINTARWNRIRYTLYAPFYDAVARRLTRGRKRAVELLEVKDGERVLIVGCGTGLDLELLPRNARVTAIDITPAMVEKTRERARVLGVMVDARTMDASRLELVDGAFDVVLLHLILAVVPDPYSTAKEAARVLRVGGRTSIFDKFVRDDAAPSVGRKMANLVTNLVATDITRRLGDLLRDTPLRIVREEDSLFGGTFRVVIAEKKA